jgi:hypothetical protein
MLRGGEPSHRLTPLLCFPFLHGVHNGVEVGFGDVGNLFHRAQLASLAKRVGLEKGLRIVR